MKNLIPHFIHEKLLSNSFSGSSDGFAIFVDMSGFTRLTETLLEEGKSGAERLSIILNAIFEPMVGLVYDHGGFIPHFAGDAFLGIFLNGRTQLTAEQVLAISQKLFHLLEQASVHFEGFEINIKVGISHGEIVWGIVGKENKSFYFRGEGIERCTVSQTKAEKQQVIVDESFRNFLPPAFALTKVKGSRFFLVEEVLGQDRLNELLAKKVSQNTDPPSKKILLQFLPKAVIQYNQQGEFRAVVSVFISFNGLQGHEALDGFASVVLEQACNFAGYFKEIEFGDKGGVAFVIFGAPVSFENNIERALEFVSAINDELLPMHQHQTFQYKVGIATGNAYTGIIGGRQRAQYAAVGNRVNIAARLMMHAKWGEVLVDEEVHKQGNFRFEHQGDITYKGLQEEIPTYQLTGRNLEHRQTFNGSMVGRGAELTTLVELALQAFDQKKPTVAYVYGEAGVGKTRLAFELKSKLRKLRRLRWLSCRSDQILRKPFNPFISLLRNYFGQSSDNSHNLNFENFEQRFTALVNEIMYVQHPQAEQVKREVIRTKPVLAALTGLKTTNSLWDNLDAKGRYENTLSALTSVIQAEALLRPVVIELEDGHWFDDSSLDFLGELTGKITQFPMFFLVTSRYDDEGQRPKVFSEEILAKHSIEVAVVDLNILDASALRSFANERLTGEIDEELLDLLLRTSNGNPFYAEQMLEYFMENELLKKAAGKWCVKDPNVRISDSIQAVLTARIDRLSNQVKETVKAAAVIGREFELPVLSAVLKNSDVFSAQPDEVSTLLRNQVKTAERAQIWQAMNELRYIFRHALLREAVYDMQLKTRLKELHRLIAEAIEKLYPRTLEQHYVDLVFHYQQAEVKPKLIDYLQKAADHAKSLYQNHQALQFYDRLLNLLKEEDDSANSTVGQQADILLKKGSILELTGQWEECENIYREALQIIRQTHDSSLLGRANNQLGYLLMLKGNYDEADTYLETAAAFFGSIHNNRGTSKVYGNLGTLYFRQGKYEDAKLYFIRSIQLAQLYKHTPSNAQIVATLGLTYMNLGKYDDGIRWQQSQLDLCKRVNDRPGMATLYVNMGIVYFEKGDYDAALECHQKGLALAEELGNKQLTAIAIGCLGTVWQRKGKFEAAMRNYERDLLLTEELGDKQGISIALGLIGELYSIMGKFDKAIEYMARNLSISEELGYQKGVAKALNSLGDIYFYTHEFETSLQFYDRSITVTRSISNKLVLAFSLVEKGQVLLSMGQTGAAQQHLDEALQLADELKQPDLLFEARLFSAKLLAANNDQASAQATLDQLLSERTSEQDLAALYFEYASLAPQGAHRQMAIDIYEKLYEQTPMFVYKLRLDELRKFD